MTDTFRSGLTIFAALTEAAAELSAAGLRNGRRDAELLLFHVTGITRTELITEPKRLLSDGETQLFRELIARRKAAEPIQYITGSREFYGLTFRVGPGVLIPRPETEHLVEAALEQIPPGTPSRIADVGTGSGAIAIALAVARPLLRVIATDISASALKIAESNASTHGVANRIRFCESDLLNGMEHSGLDMVVSNPPYIADDECDGLDPEVRNYEPSTALFAGPTGLEVYERLIPQAARAMRLGGWLLMEIGQGQKLQLQLLLECWQGVSFVPDLQGIPRVVLAQRS